MFEVIWEVAGGPILAMGLVGLVLFLFGARRFTAMAHLAARNTVGQAARAEADPLSGLSFDERVAARLRELETSGAEPGVDPIAAPAVGSDAPSPSRPTFGRKRA